LGATANKHQHCLGLTIQPTPIDERFSGDAGCAPLGWRKKAPAAGTPQTRPRTVPGVGCCVGQQPAQRDGEDEGRPALSILMIPQG